MSALANDTAINEGGYGPSPIGGTKGPESVIRMVREELEIEFSRDFTEVKAKFYFRSTKKGADAKQILGFPDLGAASVEANRRDPSGGKIQLAYESDTADPLENLRTLVDGTERPSKLQYGWVRYEDGFFHPVQTPNASHALMAWHTVEVTFPPGKEVLVERQYRAPNGANALGMRFFEYTTATGGVWQGTIGKLTATVTLKGDLTIDSLAWDGGRNLPRSQRENGPFTQPSYTNWERLSPTKMQLVWEDFEPRTEESRRGFAICLPQTVQDEPSR